MKNKLMFHGFTRIEASVYVKLLESGRSKVSEIGKLTGITRTQLYPLLENMVEKGYIKEFRSKPVSYEALDPKNLVKSLKEKRKKQIKSLSELEKELKQIEPVEENESSHRVYLIKGKANIMRKVMELWKGSKKEVIMTTSFERNILEGSRKLKEIRKKKNIKTTVYLSMEEKNLYKISKFREIFKNADFGGLVEKADYTTIVFDKEFVMTIFYDRNEKDYQTAFYFENEELAKSFAHRHIAPVESHPLRGELKLKTIGGERAIILPPVLDMISKEEQYKLGYGVGWYGIKDFGGDKSFENLMTMLEMQIMINGWGKVEIKYGKNKAELCVENSVVTPEFVRGDIVGFLSVLGDFIVKKTKGKKNCFNFSIKAKK